jgi:hypothetical protein
VTTPYYTHQVIELPEIQMAVTHVVLHATRCPQYGRRLKAKLPAAHRYGYGPRLTALIGELSGSQRGSRSAVQEFCTSVLGVPISQGAMQRVVDRISDAITPHYEAIAGKARSTKVNYIDETAWYEHGVLASLWVMANTMVALFTVQASRDKTAFAALIERWVGLVVSDGYGVYQHWVHGRQTCLAHLIRRARGLSERKEPELAKFGHRVMAVRSSRLTSPSSLGRRDSLEECLGNGSGRPRPTPRGIPSSMTSSSTVRPHGMWNSAHVPLGCEYPPCLWPGPYDLGLASPACAVVRDGPPIGGRRRSAPWTVRLCPESYAG